MSGSLSCIRPAVSMSTTSKSFSLAVWICQSCDLQAAKVHDAPYVIASFAIPAASFPYPLSNSSTPPLPSPVSPAFNMLRFRTCTLSCSTAPLLKVSHAAMSTRRPFWMSQKHTFERFVLFPTPLTPTKVILYGMRCCVDGSGEESLVRMERSRSVDVLGVRMRVRELDSARRTAALVAARMAGQLSLSMQFVDNVKRTLETTDFLAHKTFPDALTHFIRDIHRDVLLHKMLLHRFQHRLQIRISQHL